MGSTSSVGFPITVSVFSLAVFLWALLPEIKWMMMMMMITVSGL